MKIIVSLEGVNRIELELTPEEAALVKQGQIHAYSIGPQSDSEPCAEGPSLKNPPS